MAKVFVQSNIDVKSSWNFRKHWPPYTMIHFVLDQNHRHKLNDALWSHAQWLMGMKILIQGSCPHPTCFVFIYLKEEEEKINYCYYFYCWNISDFKILFFLSLVSIETFCTVIFTIPIWDANYNALVPFSQLSFLFDLFSFLFNQTINFFSPNFICQKQKTKTSTEIR